MLRNGPQGYGAITRSLHWLTVLLLVAQYAVALLMLGADDGDDSGRGRGRGRGRSGESGRGRGRGGDDEAGEFVNLVGGLDLTPVHVSIGLSLIVVTLVRLVWRRIDTLPPWSERLTAADRRFAHVSERILLGLLLVVPASGLLVWRSGDDDLLWVHVSLQFLLLATIAAHVVLVLRRGLLGRMVRGGA